MNQDRCGQLTSLLFFLFVSIAIVKYSGEKYIPSKEREKEELFDFDGEIRDLISEAFEIFN